MSAAPKSSFQRQKWQTETAENVAEINGFLGIEIFASFLAMWLSLRPSGDPSPSSQFSWQRWHQRPKWGKGPFCTMSLGGGTREKNLFFNINKGL